MSANITNVRRKIDKIDALILKQLAQRAALAEQIGKIKAANGSDIYSSARESMVLQRVAKNARAPLSGADAQSVFQEILNVCRNLQKPMRISYFGPQATFTHQVALKHFGKSALMQPQKSITDVFTEVEKNRADYGVVPIENSTEGGVNHTLDMFLNSDLKICAERQETISHYLLSVSGQKNAIKKVVSHPQALAQCRQWLATHLPKAEQCPVASTAEAASQAATEDSWAAISSHLASDIYNLKVVAERIEDLKENFTRFLVIGQKFSAPSGKDKTSILFTIKHNVGALNDVLLIFKKAKINLTKIESRPSRKKVWEYVFFVDFWGHCQEAHVHKALQQLQKHCQLFKILGSYPRSEV